MSLDQLQNKKEWKYMKKSEKISQYLKDKNKEYPAKPMSLKRYLAECCFDLGFRESDFLSYLNIMAQLDMVEIIGDQIVSIPAREKQIANQNNVSDVVKEIIK